MISKEKCEKLLNTTLSDYNYNREEVIQIRDFLYSVAEIELNQIENNFNIYKTQTK